MGGLQSTQITLIWARLAIQGREAKLGGREDVPFRDNKRFCTGQDRTELPGGLPVAAEVADARRVQVEAEFGSPDEEYELSAIWHLDLNALERAVAFELAGPRSHKDRLDPTSLHFGYWFSWRPPWRGDHENSSSQSRLGVNISGARLFFQPHLVFLTTIESPNFREQLVSVEPALPFKLNDNYFKRWVINPKRGNMGRYLKTERGWRDRWVEN